MALRQRQPRLTGGGAEPGRRGAGAHRRLPRLRASTWGLALAGVHGGCQRVAEARGQASEVRQDGAVPVGGQLCRRDAPDPKWAQLCGWLEDACGATGLENVYAAEFVHAGTSVRGIGAARSVRSGEPVFCVPKACWMREGSEAQRVIELTGEACSNPERLAIHIAEQRRMGPESFWAPYLQVLPTEDDYRRFHPAYLENYTLEPEVSYWAHWTQGLTHCHATYQQKAGDSAASFEEVYLAFVQLYTRRYGDVDMVPLGDLANTAPEAQLNVQPSYSDTSREIFCLRASKDLQVGDELLVNYGAELHSAMLMFSLYGFALAPEHHNQSLHGQGPDTRAVDGCAGLWPASFPEPRGDADPILRNYWHFAGVHCRTAAGGGPDLGMPGPAAAGQAALLMAVSFASFWLGRLTAPPSSPAAPAATAAPRSGGRSKKAE